MYEESIVVGGCSFACDMNTSFYTAAANVSVSVRLLCRPNYNAYSLTRQNLAVEGRRVF